MAVQGNEGDYEEDEEDEGYEDDDDEEEYDGEKDIWTKRTRRASGAMTGIRR